MMTIEFWSKLSTPLPGLPVDVSPTLIEVRDGLRLYRVQVAAGRLRDSEVLLLQERVRQVAEASPLPPPVVRDPPPVATETERLAARLADLEARVRALEQQQQRPVPLGEREGRLL